MSDARNLNGASMRSEPNSRRLEVAAERLRSHHQEQVLTGIDGLDDAQLTTFLDELESVDLDEIDRLSSGIGVESDHSDASLPAPEPAPYVARDSDEAMTCRAAGEELIAQGGVAAFTVAGGQGTRLGWKGPKGTFPATPVAGKPLFRVFAEQITAMEQRYDVEIPWYVMTSPLNDADTRAFFEDNKWFGKARSTVSLFPQGVMPAVDQDGRMLLEAPGRLALSPDGHGGSLRALRRSGSLEDMRNRGIKVISYFQVDNPNVHVIDPVFIGLHARHPDSSGDMSSKMVPKCEAGEKVGVFCRVGGHTCVIEYSDLDPALAEATEADGRLKFLSGSIALHVLGVDFVDRLTAPDSQSQLPFHRAHKKVPCWDAAAGRTVEPEAPNGIKFEMFVFDALNFAERSIVLETDRVEEFAPIKNAEGTDSAQTSRDLQVERAGRWIEAAGGSVPRQADGTVDAEIEIEASTALEAGDLDGDALPGIKPGESILF